MIGMNLVTLDEILIPTYANPDEDAGMDLRSSESVCIPPNSQAMIRTGIKLAMTSPSHFLDPHFRRAVFIRGRSGLASKGVWCFHGTIDSGYRDEIKVILRNFNDTPFEIKRGDKIAQMVAQYVTPVSFNSLHVSKEKFESFENDYPSSRGTGGFGSTDIPKGEKGNV